MKLMRGCLFILALCVGLWMALLGFVFVVGSQFARF